MERQNKEMGKGMKEEKKRAKSMPDAAGGGGVEEVKRRAVKGGMWVLGLRFIERGFGVLRLIILARLLSPSDFGLMGIAMLMMGVLNTFSQTGFQAVLVSTIS